MPKEVVQLGEAQEAKMASYLYFGLCNPGTVAAPVWVCFLAWETEVCRPSHCLNALGLLTFQMSLSSKLLKRQAGQDS